MSSASERTAVDDMPERIRAYIAEKLNADDLRLESLQQIAVGWSHETWLFDACWTESGEARSLGLCLRRDPGNALLRHLSDLGDQFRVLECLDAAPVPTPRPYWYEAVPNVLGAPFLVMEKVPGTCPNPWGRQGRKFYADAAQRGVLPGSFTGSLAALHTLDWQAAGLDFLGVPKLGTNEFALREVRKWRELIDVSGHKPEPVLVDLIGWLEANAPVTDRLAFVHGAYRTGNLLIDNDQISAVLDWELQVIGDPMYDVAYVISDLNREGSDLLSNLVPRDEFYRQYETTTGLTIDEEACRYYQLLYAMRSVAFWMSASGLYAQRQSNDVRLARTAWSVPVVLERAARDLGY
ncbi:MAG: phosphotransferase family protein [Gammaproteobacteria bacterium]|nr:phosphotransferase family protein [Gammaproteobacteria bacterium]